MRTGLNSQIGLSFTASESPITRSRNEGSRVDEEWALQSRISLAMHCLAGFLMLATMTEAAEPVPLSPTALAASADGKTLYVACATGRSILQFGVDQRKVLSALAMPGTPSGLALSSSEKELYVTCAAPESKVYILDLAQQKIIATIPAGHTAAAPVLSRDGKTLFVCNQFDNDVSVVDVAARKEMRRIKVQREPVAAAITKDGKFLLVNGSVPSFGN